MIYNRVEDIDEVAGHVQKLVPDLVGCLCARTDAGA